MEEIYGELHNLLKVFLERNSDGIRELAHEFGVSLTTIRRWVEGKNFPHRAMCPPIIIYIKGRMLAGS